MKIIFAALLASGALTAWGQALAQPPMPQIIPTPPGPATQSLILSTSAVPQFQVRRRIFAEVCAGIGRNDPAAKVALDKVLTDYESAALRYTPLETLEIIGFYYLPREGMETSFQVIVIEQVMGWYDVLRYASESGRAAIVNNEAFFKMPMIIGGPLVAARAAKYFNERPAQTRQMLDQGFALADAWRETQNYDRHWPAYYGLERLICLQDQNSCQPVPELERSKWGGAWLEAKQRVAEYYNFDKH